MTDEDATREAEALPHASDADAHSDGVLPIESAVAVGSARGTTVDEALDRLRRAGIRSFAESTDEDALNLFVGADDAADARTVLATLGDEVGTPVALAVASDEQSRGSIDSQFHELVSQLEFDSRLTDDSARGAAATTDPPTSATPAASGSSISDEVSRRLGADPDPPELRDEHFVPPTPPPVPRPSRAGTMALVVLGIGIAILSLGRLVGLSADESLTFGVLATLAGAYLLSRRLKRYRDDDDDGARV